MLYSFPCAILHSSPKLLLHLVSLTLVAIHVPHPLHGQQHQQYTYQDDRPDYDTPYSGTYDTTYNTYEDPQADTPAVENAGMHMQHMQPTEWIGMRPPQDLQQDPQQDIQQVPQPAAPQQDFAWYGEAENWNDANVSAYQEGFPCQNPSQECAQNPQPEAEPEPVNNTCNASCKASCNAPAYAQATKITKLCPITVVAGLLVVSVVAVAILSSQTHQHTAKSKSHCRSCR